MSNLKIKPSATANPTTTSSYKNLSYATENNNILLIGEKVIGKGNLVAKLILKQVKVNGTEVDIYINYKRVTIG